MPAPCAPRGAIPAIRRRPTTDHVRHDQGVRGAARQRLHQVEFSGAGQRGTLCAQVGGTATLKYRLQNPFSLVCVRV